MKSDLKCEVVKDLLVIYNEKMTNDVTNQEISQHLEECPDCTSSYKAIQSSAKSPNEKYNDDIKFMVKIKRKYLITLFVSILCAALVIVSTFQIYGYLRYKQCAVPAKYINISDVYLLTNGKLICKVDVTEDCPFTINGLTSHSSGDKVYSGGISEEYNLWDSWFGDHENRVSSDNINDYVLMDISNYVSVSDSDIQSTGSVTIVYEGEDRGDTLLIWKTGEPLLIAPVELEDYVKSESLLGYYI